MGEYFVSDDALDKSSEFLCLFVEARESKCALVGDIHNYNVHMYLCYSYTDV